MPPPKSELPKSAHLLSIQYGKLKITAQGLGVAAVILIVVALAWAGKLPWAH